MLDGVKNKGFETVFKQRLFKGKKYFPDDFCLSRNAITIDVSRQNSNSVAMINSISNHDLMLRSVY